MDYVKKAWSTSDYWTPEMLQREIIRCAYHAQGHPQHCRCPWCFQGDTLNIILTRRPDIVHGPHCKERCYHVTDPERDRARIARQNR